MNTDQQERLTLEQQRQSLRDDYEQSIRDFYALAKVQSKKKRVAAFQSVGVSKVGGKFVHKSAVARFVEKSTSDI